MEKQIPPHSEEAEMSVLGAILIDSNIMDRVKNVSPKMFYFQKHQDIFYAMLMLHAKGMKIDLLTLSDQLKGIGKFELVGGNVYLIELTESIPTSAHWKEYYRILFDKSQSRLMMRFMDNIDIENPAEAIKKFDERVKAAKKYFDKDYLQEHSDNGDDVILQIDKPTTGLTWGSQTMKKTISPIEEHHFIVLAGRGSSGKTSLSYYIAMENVKKNKKVAFFSLEMNRQTLIEVLCRKRAGITTEQWADRDVPGVISEAQDAIYRKEYNGFKDIEDKFIIVCPKDKSLKGLEDAIESIRPDLVIIDNMDIIAANMEGNMSPIEKHVKISNWAMEHTNENKIPIMILHHFNKSGTVSGPEKIRDCVDTLITMERSPDCDTPEEKAQVNFVLDKDRDGENMYSKFELYFDKGMYRDSYEYQPRKPIQGQNSSDSKDLTTNQAEAIFNG